MKAPSQSTLDKYGLSESDWVAIYERQGASCAVCKTPQLSREVFDKKTKKVKTKTSVFCIDHEHVKDYKKLPPEQRARYVRGLLCFWCNKCYVGRGITIEKSQNVTAFLLAYAQRRGEA